MPLGSQMRTRLGCTGPLTGDFQPSCSSPRLARQMPMPRVGSTTNRSRPLWTSTTSTPRLAPVRSVRFVTE